MRSSHAPKASAIGAAVVGSVLTVAACPANADFIDVGYVTQVSPRPALTYTGAWGSFVSSSIVANPQQRTLVTIDLYGILQASGFNALERIEILDGGGNQYLGSPGADIDYWSLSGVAPGTTIAFDYTGVNPIHLGESSEELAARTLAMDAVSGDQDWSVSHFVSLGQGGLLGASFTVPGSGAGGGSSGGGSGPGQNPGGGSGGGVPSNLILATPDLKLHLSEAGLGERYFIRIVAAQAIPGPGALTAIAMALAGGRSRRRRRD